MPIYFESHLKNVMLSYSLCPRAQDCSVSYERTSRMQKTQLTLSHSPFFIVFSGLPCFNGLLTSNTCCNRGAKTSATGILSALASGGGQAQQNCYTLKNVLTLTSPPPLQTVTFSIFPTLVLSYGHSWSLVLPTSVLKPFWYPYPRSTLSFCRN